MKAEASMSHNGVWATVMVGAAEVGHGGGGCMGATPAAQRGQSAFSTPLSSPVCAWGRGCVSRSKEVCRHRGGRQHVQCKKGMGKNECNIGV